MRLTSTSLVILSGLILRVSAQGVSSTCQSTVTTLALGPAGTCLGISRLLGVYSTPANESIIQPINDWLTYTCAQTACTNDTLDDALDDIMDGCRTDLGLAEQTADRVEDGVEDWYAPGREVARLKDTNDGNAFCVTQTLLNYESSIGRPLSISWFLSALPSITSGEINIASNISCTDCTQAAYALIRQRLNETNRGAWDAYIGEQCGSNFTPGVIPSSIQQSANPAPPGSGAVNNGAMSLAAGLGTALLGVGGTIVLVL